MMVTNEVIHDSRVLREAEALSRLGFQVSILGMIGEGAPPSEERSGATILLCRKWKATSWVERKEGRAWEIPHKLLEAFQYLIFSRRGEGEIIHAHDLDTLPFAFLAARRCRAKLIYDSHELYLEQWPESSSLPFSSLLLPLLRSLEGFLIRRADATMTVNESIARELSRRYSIPPPLILRNCAAAALEETDAVSLRHRLGLSQEDRIVLHTGALNARGRALKELVLAFRNLKPEIHLVFLGRGRMEKALKDLAQAEALEGRVHFLPPLLPEELTGAMKEADLASVMMKVEGSLNNLYSLPNKLFEAIAAGIPVVASDLPEIAKVVRSYEIGLLCNAEDPEEIARAIEEALSPDRYASFKGNLKRAQQELNWGRESQKLVNLYQGLMKGRG